MKSFSLTINDFSRGGYELLSGFLPSNYKSLTTFNLTLTNNCAEVVDYKFPCLLDAVMQMNSLRTLRLKIDRSKFRTWYSTEYDFSNLVVKSPSLELIELTLGCYGDVGSLLENFEMAKTVTTDKLQVHTVFIK